MGWHPLYPIQKTLIILDSGYYGGNQWDRRVVSSCSLDIPVNITRHIHRYL